MLNVMGATQSNRSILKNKTYSQFQSTNSEISSFQSNVNSKSISNRKEIIHSENGLQFSPSICGSCGKIFQFKCLLVGHRLHCIKLQKRKKNLSREIQKSLIQRKRVLITCSVCHKEFNSTQKYEFHRENGPCSNKHFPCANCEKKFPSLEELQTHQCNVSLPITPPKTLAKRKHDIFKCFCCESTFALPESLKKHLLLNKVCSNVHHSLIKREFQKKKNKKLTARKSFPNSPAYALTNSKHGINMSSSARKSFPNSPANKYLNASLFSSPLPSVTGSARKSIRSSSYESYGDEYFCTKCGLCFNSLVELKLHQKDSHSKNSLSNFKKCPRCIELFSSSSELFQHQKEFDHFARAVKSIIYTCSCPFCEKKFFHIQNRNAHLRYHTEKMFSEIKEFVKNTTCNICFRTFGTEVSKEQHSRIAHFSTSFKNYSNKPSLLKNSSNLGDSMKLKTLTKVSRNMFKQLQDHPNLCPVCIKTYETTTARNRHFRLHVLAGSYECEFCSLKFPVPNYLNSHIKNEHQDAFKYECKECGEHFFSRLTILQHIVKDHSHSFINDLIVERNVPSSKSSSVIHSMQQREAASDGATREEFHCDVCNLNFLKLCGLRRHQMSKLHTNLVEAQRLKKEKTLNMKLQIPPRAVTPPDVDYSKTITCSECSTEFTKASEFIPHRLSHFSEQNEAMQDDEDCIYTCEVCGKLLDSYQKIQMHLFWHLQDVHAKASDSDDSGNIYKAKKSMSSAKAVKSPASIPKHLIGQTVAKKSFKPVNAQEVVIGGVKQPLFTCKNCSISFTTKQHYLLHIHQYCRGSNNEEALVNDVALYCSICEKTFCDRKSLHTHQLTCDLETKKKYCSTCGCLFSTPSLYKDHQTEFCTPKFTAHIDENLISKNIEPLKNALNAESSIIGCAQCSLLTTSVLLLSTHMQKHVILAVNGIDSKDSVKEENEDDDYVDVEGLTEITSSTPNDKTPTNFKDSSCDSYVNSQDTDLTTASTTTANNLDIFGVDSQDCHTVSSEAEFFPSNSTSTQEEIIELRNNFSQLLDALVSDSDLMQNLGYGQKLIDEVLISVLKKMALSPVDDDSLSELDKLRCNIRTLLDVCIKDQIMDFIVDQEITTDKIVIAALKMFGVDVQ